MENYYELLEVSKNASDEVISKVFKYHIKKNHPDLFSEKEKIQAEIKVKKLNEAYEVLSNSEKRKEYDKMLLEQENSRNTTTEDIINNLNIEKEYLLHTIDKYNRFINEYFYEKSDEVFNIIDNYDSVDYYTYGKFQNNNEHQSKNESLIKEKIKNYIFRSLVYLTTIMIFFLIISLLFRINVFEILFNVLFS